MSQESLGGLAWLSIINEGAKNFEFRKVIRQFASAKARRTNFKFFNHLQVNYGSLLS